MKILLDIKDDKAAFILELLNNFKYVKTKQLTASQAEMLFDLREAVEELNEIKAGNKKGVPLKEFLSEL